MKALGERLAEWGRTQGRAGWAFSLDICMDDGPDWGKVEAAMGPCIAYGRTTNEAINNLADGMTEEGWPDDRPSEDEHEAREDCELPIDTLTAPTPDDKKGIWRSRGDTLLSECIYLMERMFMESLNGVLCQVPDEERWPGPCDNCTKCWAELKALMDRYDVGER